MKRRAPKNVDEYLATLPPASRRALEDLRAIIKQAAPGAEEYIGYGMPGYRMNGPLVYFAAFKDHLSFFPGSASVDRYADALKGFTVRKGTIQFTPEKPVPPDLVRRIVKDRLKENEEKANTKKKP